VKASQPAKTLTTATSKASVQEAVITDKAVRSMADAIFKHLQDEGCQAKDIINVSSQLLGLVTTQISAPKVD